VRKLRGECPYRVAEQMALMRRPANDYQSCRKKFQIVSDQNRSTDGIQRTHLWLKRF